MGEQMVFVTGASRGMGTEFVKAAHAAGHAVVATGRRAAGVTAAVGDLDDVLVAVLDVTDTDRVSTAVVAATAVRADRCAREQRRGSFKGYFEEMSPDRSSRSSRRTCSAR